MKVLILGSGGREHALGWALRRDDPDLELLFCPGNGGTGALGRNVPGDLGDLDGLVDLARSEQADLTLVGPEAPLVAGVADRFRKHGLPVFGPVARAARLEGSKVFAKSLLREHGIPTPGFDVFTDPSEARRAAGTGRFPKVLKAEGLAAGKGVLIVEDAEEAEAGIHALMEEREFGQAGERILVEEFVQGEEISCFILARGEEFRLLPLSQDHKRIGEGDTGPNTGGMGAYAPYPGGGPELVRTIETTIVRPVLSAMAAQGVPFHGLLYAGLIMNGDEPQVLEFNCRFGDPETQAVLPLLDRGLLGAVAAVATGEGTLPELRSRETMEARREAGTAGGNGEGPLSAATVVLASRGYPGSYEKGKEITGLDRAAEIPGAVIFHAGTRQEADRFYTSGGRVLAVTGLGAGLSSALKTAYAACDRIDFEGKTLRRDIGWRVTRD